MDFQSTPDIEQQRKARVEEHRSLYLSTGGVSKHIGAKKYNESNPGIGLLYQWGDGDTSKFVTGGKYRNSIDKDSYYAGGGMKKRLLGNDNFHVDGGVIGGVISGYSPSLTPAIMPMLSIDGKNAGVDLMYVPKIDGVTPETYMLNGRIKLK